MQKGKFGFALWLYPYIALWSLFVWETSAMLVCLALALFVIAMEKDEWCIKQCLKTVMFAVYWGVYNIIINALSDIPVAGYVFMIIDFIVTVAVFIVVWILGLSRLTKGMDISIPGKGIVNRAYGMIQQYTVQQPYTQPTAQPTAQPYTQPAAQPTAQPYTQPVAQPYPQPTVQPYVQSADQSYVQPADQPLQQPETQTASQSAVQPIQQAAAPTVIQQASQTAPQEAHMQTSQNTGQTQAGTEGRKIIGYNTMTGEPIYEE